MLRSNLSMTGKIAALCSLGLLVGRALGGPNLVAVGSFDLPYEEAEPRESLSEGAIFFEFEGDHDFGRVVLRTTTPHSVVRTATERMRVYYTGTGLLIDFGNAQMQDRRVTVWFRLEGKLRPQKTYEYVFAMYATQQNYRTPIPALVPAFWADGKLIGTDVALTEPVLGEEQAERIQREQYIRGKVKLDDFERQTGGAWIVVDIPSDMNDGVFIPWVSFREIDEDLLAGKAPEMPVPVRYIPLSSPAIGQIGLVMDRGPFVVRQQQNEDASWGDGDANHRAEITSLVVQALGEWRRPANPEDPEDNRKRLDEEEQLDRAREFLAGLKAQPDGTGDGERNVGGNTNPPPPRNPPPGGGGRGGRSSGGRGSSPPPNVDRSSGGTNDVLDITQTSAVAARLICLSRAPDRSKYRRIINADVEWLTDAQMEDGGWATFSLELERNRAVLEDSDNQSTEQAIIALREAHFGGVPADKKVWIKAAEYLVKAQAQDGGFREKLDEYGGLGEATNVLRTASGITSMLTVLDLGYGALGTSCTSYLANKGLTQAVERSLGWMHKNYDEYFSEVAGLDPGEGSNPFLIALAMQRLGDTSGLTRFNDKDHFTKQAEEMFEFFDPASSLFNGDIYLSAIALRVLSAGAAAPVLQRIIVGGEPAMESSADVPHLIRHLMASKKEPLAWHRSTIDRPLRDLLRAPVMVLKVMGPFDWGPKEWGKIRDYCFGGGVVILDVAADQQAQRPALESKIKELFPEYEPRALDKDDAAANAVHDLNVVPRAKVLHNGFRGFLYIPEESWSCAWHLNRTEQDKDKFEIIENLIEASSGGEILRDAFSPPTYEIGAKPDRRVAVDYMETGSSVPAYPDMIDSLDRLMQANYRVNVVKPDGKSANAAELMWLSVTGATPMNGETKKRVAKHIEGGGFLFADVVSGDAKRAEQLSADLLKVDPSLSLKRLRQSDAIFTGEVGGTQGFDVRRVHLRKALHTPFSEHGRCDLYALMKKDKMVGAVSHYDVVSGLSYTLFPDCRGVMPDDARKLAVNTVLTAMSLGKRPGK